MSLSVAFRADASRQIGGGHVMRCLTLADALRQAGARCVFLCRALPGDLFQAIRESGHTLTMLPAPAEAFAPTSDDPSHAAWAGLPWAEDARQSAAALEAGVDWLVLDHYAFGSRWVAAMRARAARVLAIDELDDRPLDADLLLDQSRLPSLGPREHIGRIDTLVGPGFALLRPEFRAWRSESLARRAQTAGAAPPRLLISTGLMDVGGAALLAAEALAPLGLAMDVAIGSGAPSADALRGVAARAAHVSPRLDASNMAQLMTQADLAIGAAGATSWERLCLGLPSLLFVIADNQRVIAEGLARDGGATILGAPGRISTEELRRVVREKLADRAGLLAESRRCAAMCDGAGVDRVAARMRALAA